MATPPIRWGSISFAESYPSYLEWLRTGEELGYSVLGHGDSQSLWADPYVSLAYAASNTHSARLGPMVTNPVTRHPAVAASAMGGLQRLSKGRAIFGVGTGDSALLNIGERPSRIDAFEAYCRAVKGLCAGETVEWRGKPLQMHWAVTPVPLWIAAEGPKMLHLAGRIADGVILALGLTPEVIEDTIARIRAGAQSAGRRFEDIELWWMTKPYLAKSEEQAWHELAWSLAGSANHAFRFSLEGKFVPEEHREGLLAVQREYAADTHGRPERGAQNAAMIERHGLSEWLGRRFLLAGPPEVIDRRLRECAALGARNFLFAQVVADKPASMRKLHQEVMHAFVQAVDRDESGA